MMWRGTSGCRVAVALVAGAACVRAAAQGGLDELVRVREATSARTGSASPDPASNGDNRWVKPGETLTIAEVNGPGVVRRIWMTFAEAGPSWISKEGAANPSEVVVRMYWDGAAAPAVEAPLGDFFAAGFGKRVEVNSAPVVVQAGDSYSCFWAMPFFKSARITLTNESSKPLAALYYQVDYTREEVPEEAAYFCAQYRQEFPTRMGSDYLIADIAGAGHYVGTVMSVRSRSPKWFGEGDDKFYVDGGLPDGRPTMQGTGTEDYFLNAWGMEKGCYPYFGVTTVSGDLDDPGVWCSMYRWHIADPVRFRKSLRVTIEHAGWISADETSTGKVEGFVEREDDFATVAFWYQRGQPKRFAVIPAAKERELPQIDLVIEGKEMKANATAQNAALSLQSGGAWTGEGQLFIDAREDSTVRVSFDVPGGTPRCLVAAFTHSYDFGEYRISIDGKVVAERMDFYGPKVEVMERVLSEAVISPGTHVLTLQCTGKNAASSGLKLGVDALRLRERSTAKRVPLGRPVK